MHQARNLAWKLQEGKISTRFPFRDRDSTFTLGFDEVFKSEGVEVIRLAYPRPATKRLFGEEAVTAEDARRGGHQC